MMINDSFAAIQGSPLISQRTMRQLSFHSFTLFPRLVSFCEQQSSPSCACFLLLPFSGVLHSPGAERTPWKSIWAFPHVKIVPAPRRTNKRSATFFVPMPGAECPFQTCPSGTSLPLWWKRKVHWWTQCWLLSQFEMLFWLTESTRYVESSNLAHKPNVFLNASFALPT